MRRKLLAVRRVAFGPRPLLTLAVILAAVSTAVLKNSGFEEWWALPAALLTLLGVDSAMRRDR